MAQPRSSDALKYGLLSNGQVTIIDTTGNTTFQLARATPKTTYSVQFCPSPALSQRVRLLPVWTTLSEPHGYAAGGAGVLERPELFHSDWLDPCACKSLLISQPTRRAIPAKYIHSIRTIMAVRLPYVAL